MESNGRFVIFAGPEPERAVPKASEPFPLICSGDYVVCADGGYAACKAAGITPAAVIGDDDSLSDAQKNELAKLGIEHIVHPIEKDETDTMLCVLHGLELGFESFLIVGGIGGNFGHTIANLQILSYLADMECQAELLTESQRVFMLSGTVISPFREPVQPAPFFLKERPGLKFTVLSYAERSSGVFVKNAKYELTDAVLTQSYPVGVSNEVVNEEPVEISVLLGRLLIIVDV